MIQTDPEQWAHGAADTLKLRGRNIDQRFRWNAWIISCVAAGLPPPLFSFIWLVVPDLWGLCAISQSSSLQLVHRWLRTTCYYISLASACLWNGPWYCYLGGLENQEEHKAKLLARCWSIDDTVPGLHLCLPHLICAASMLGRDKQQRDTPVFPSLSALISKDWMLASRCYNRNHLCSAWDQYLTAGLFSRWTKPLFLHKNSVFSFKTKVGAFPVVQMCS